MKPHRHIYMYLSARIARRIAANHRVRDRQNDDPSLGGIPVDVPERFDPGREYV
jgi:hypothetical protein